MSDSQAGDDDLLMTGWSYGRFPRSRCFLYLQQFIVYLALPFPCPNGVDDFFVFPFEVISGGLYVAGDFREFCGVFSGSVHNVGSSEVYMAGRPQENDLCATSS